MKEKLVLLLFFFLGLFLFGKFGPGFPISVNQITTNKSDAFTVSAEGKVVAKPDTAQVSLGVQTSENTVKQAQDSANKIISDVTAATKKLGVEDKDIKTTNYSVYPDEQFGVVDQLPAPMVSKTLQPSLILPTPRRITKYRVNVNLMVTVRNFDQLNQVIDAATANGANQVGGISFTVDKIEQYQSQARKIAIDNARAKAEEIAKQAGITLVRIINVSDNYSNYNPMPMMAKAVDGSGGGTTTTQVEPGSSEITVTVTLSYETK